MSRASLGIAFVVAGTIVAFIIVSAGSASSATVKQCHKAYNRCMDGCDKLADGGDGSPRAKCVGKCGLQLVNCSPWKLPQPASDRQTTTGTTQPPQKGPRGVDAAGVSRDKQLGGGKIGRPKGKMGLDTVNVGGGKQIGGGGLTRPKGKMGLDDMKVGTMSSGQKSGGVAQTQRSRGGLKKR